MAKTESEGPNALERDYWRYQEEYERRRIQEEDEYHWNCLSFNIARMKA